MCWVYIKINEIRNVQLQTEEITFLKQKLAEKEEEISNLKKENSRLQKKARATTLQMIKNI